MARVLTTQRLVVPPADRDKYMERVRRRRDYFTRSKCQYWLFEEVDLPGAFTEFIEAADVATLTNALEGEPDKNIGAARVYKELPLD